MKTSNKILFSFVALIVVLMLLSDVVIWANHRNDKPGGGSRDYTFTLQPFKIVKVDGSQGRQLLIVKTGRYGLRHWGDERPSYIYTQSGDTLFLKLQQDWAVELQAPELESIIMERSNVRLQGFTLPRLRVQAGDSCQSLFQHTTIDLLDFNGDRENALELSGDNKIDSLKLRLGKGSSFTSSDVNYRYSDIKVDSLSKLMLTGSSLSAVKEIR